MGYKIFSTDLDGTLLDSNGEITEANKKAIGKAIEKGVHVVLNSGRSFMSIGRFSKELNLKEKGIYGICYNGSIVYETYDDRVLRELKIKNSIAMDIIKTIKSSKNLDSSLMIYNYDRLLIEGETEATNIYSKLTKVSPSIIKFDSITTDISKIVLCGRKDNLVKLKEELSVFTDRINLIFTHETLLEIISMEASKGDSLKYLADHLNVDMNEIIAIGDNYNDLSMIEQAGLGVAVANASNDIKDKANYITKATNDESAVAEVIEKFILEI